MADHAVAFGVDVALARPDWHKSIDAVYREVGTLANKIGAVMDGAERGELAAQPTPDGNDLNIVAPAPLDPKWSMYQINPGELPPEPSLGIAPLIVLGIIVAVVIGGVVTVTALTDTVANKLERDVELATIEARAKFCEDPNSEVCKVWLQKEKSKPLKQNKSAIDYLFGAGAGKKAAAGFGVAAVVVIGVWAFSKFGGKAA